MVMKLAEGAIARKPGMTKEKAKRVIETAEKCIDWQELDKQAKARNMVKVQEILEEAVAKAEIEDERFTD